MKCEALMTPGNLGTDIASSKTDRQVLYDPKKCAGYSMKDANHLTLDSARAISPPPHHTLERYGPHGEQRPLSTIATCSCSHLCSPLRLQQ